MKLTQTELDVRTRLYEITRERDELKAKVERLREALKSISHWRRDAHAYDEDVGHKLRSFDEESVEMIENEAKQALAETNIP